MVKVVVTHPGERVVAEFDALIARPTVPSAAPPPPLGLVEISQRQATELIPGPVGPQGPRGSRWYTGSGAPTTIPGQVTGDMYLDNSNDEVWQFDGVTWNDTGTNIHGSPDTGADILVKLAPVDGAGSGLDADLLDGQHGAFYQDYANLTGKPATFPPTLPIPSSGVTGLDAAQTAQDAAIALKAPIASPTFTGDPKAPTPATADSDTSIATTAFVKAQGYIGPDAPSNGTQYVRQNAAWSPVSVPPGTYIGDTPPGSPSAGQLWWESDTGNLYIYFNDGNSSQWVQVTGPGVQSPSLTAWATYTPTFTGFGTAANVSVWSRRVGDTLYTRGKFTAGTPTATEARLTLGFGGVNANVVSDATKVPSIQLAGRWTRSTAPGAIAPTMLIESNVGYLTFGYDAAAAAGLTKQNGSAFTTAGDVVSFVAEVPISGW